MLVSALFPILGEVGSTIYVMYKIKDACGSACKGVLVETEMNDMVVSKVFLINYTILPTAILD